MVELYAGTVDEFAGDRRKLIDSDGRDVMVIRRQDRFYAYENTCPHMGGPVGEGILIGKVEAVLGSDRSVIGERFSETTIHLVCPWHGWEFDLETGACAANVPRNLRRYDVVQRDERVYVVVA